MENEELNPYHFKFVRTNKELTEAAKINANLLLPFLDDYDAFRPFEALLEYCKANELSEDDTKRICETHERVKEVLIGDNLVDPTGTNGAYFQLNENGRKAKKIGREKYLLTRTARKERGWNWIWVESGKLILSAILALLGGLALFQLKSRPQTPPQIQATQPMVSDSKDVRVSSTVTSDTLLQNKIFTTNEPDSIRTTR